MKFITIVSRSEADLAGQIRYLKEDGWNPITITPAREGRLLLMHMEKPMRDQTAVQNQTTDGTTT